MRKLIVFNRTLDRVAWHNTRLVKDDMLGEVKRLKFGDGKNLAVLGSGRVVAQLAAADLIDEYQVLINPVVLGRGRSMFEGVGRRLHLKLIRS